MGNIFKEYTVPECNFGIKGVVYDAVGWTDLSEYWTGGESL